MNGKINVVIPMAGAGSRFSKAGYDLPKPFIDVRGKMMIERVLDNLEHSNARYILIAREEHRKQYSDFIKKIEDNFPVEFIFINTLTHGAACTVCAAHRYINNDTPLVIANSDQLVDFEFTAFIDSCLSRDLDGNILTFKDTDPKWSFVKADENGLIYEVKEKQPISDRATVGIYMFKQGKDFIDGTLDMISARDTFNNEFYVCPVYNHIIRQNKKIGFYDIIKESMHGIGTPEDLTKFIETKSYQQIHTFL